MLDPSLATIFRAGRSHFNALYEGKRHQYRALQAEAFQSFIVNQLQPVALVVHEHVPERAADTVLATYRIGLELVGQRLAGPEARTPLLNHGFVDLFPRYAALIAQAPLKLLSALCNALSQLAFTPNANTLQWLTDLARLAPDIEAQTTLLRVGQVSAWRAGLSHYRQSALGVLDTLPAPLNQKLFQLAPSAEWDRVEQRLKSERWYRPDATEAATPRWVGAFSGFGGLFSVPPVVTQSGENLLAKSGSDFWLVFADAFGTTFHKATAQEIQSAAPFGHTPNLRAQRGQLEWAGRPMGVQTRGALSSAALSSAALGGQTLAVTFADSHQILLLAGQDLS